MSVPELETLLVADREQVRWITLNRPDRLNAISPAMLDELESVLTASADDPSVRVLVITGAGRAFCAGADLSPGPGDPDALPDVDLARSDAVFELLERQPQPVVAAVNGMACAGGLELLLCCDVVLAAAGVPIGDMHANAGLLPGAGGTYRLPRRVGLNPAMWLLLTGRTAPAEDFLRWGLVHRVVAAGELTAAAEELAKLLSGKSPLGLRRMKELVRDGLAQDRRTGLAHALAVAQAHQKSADYAEGVRAFAARRTPRFTGR
ncbi:enoyl-CoA hydratase/carnithine racemase [Thermocatellispora tengchongensis]|uniref:Enoyl-CoA hydratase/carnithine racemase n=1 Tax=Thermocatellispora tengchongensis TaxID=1073253 RepID=A0A840PL86_9ACTN|nr:enoyl-CoA hydratase/isomerase family protein [Thermocatellispora tengchongensis]MBB5137827.1 enoyl-CoA hydratase/carnithine racemase [Thermocatellispora tengchongensis]